MVSSTAYSSLQQWASYKFDPNLKAPDNTTNFVKSFNGKIEKYRQKPIFTLIEAVMEMFMSTIAKRADICQEWSGRVVPKIKTLLTKLEVDSRCCTITPAGMGEYSVQVGRTKFIVDLNLGDCDCMYWYISGISYKYTIRCILRERKDLETFVDEAYTIERYKLAYNVVIHLVQDPTFWPDRNLPRIGPPNNRGHRSREARDS